MNIRILTGAITLAAMPAFCQAPQPQPEGAPIYRVTVVERTMKAINYAYRTGPTMIDFRGTVLLPKAKGEAVVESKSGRTEIDAKFENLTTPQGFGLEYMTYVLWAITPEGRPVNLGEVVTNGSNKGSLRVTTDLKAFGLMITAEPYDAVKLPSDVVVEENQVRPDTIGKIEQINVKFDLMPRGHYEWNVTNQLQAEVANAPRVSMKRYEAMLELYQAQNAIAIARNAGAEQYAPNTFQKAQMLLNEAQQIDAHSSGDPHRVVDSAREATQTAEDARQITERKKQEAQLAQANAQVVAARQQAANAQAAVQQAQQQTAIAQSQADAERAARQQAEADREAAQYRATQAEQQARAAAAVANANAAVTAQNQVQLQAEQADNQRRDLRMRLLEQLNGALATRDTSWGLMVTVPDNAFAGAAVRPVSNDQIRKVTQIVMANPGLHVVIEGHSDVPASEAQAYKRATAVRDELISCGLPSTQIELRPMSDSRPIASNKTDMGREQNRRVEIVISGDPIGKFPFWDKPYTLTTHR